MAPPTLTHAACAPFRDIEFPHVRPRLVVGWGARRRGARRGARRVLARRVVRRITNEEI